MIAYLGMERTDNILTDVWWFDPFLQFNTSVKCGMYEIKLHYIDIVIEGD